MRFPPVAIATNNGDIGGGEVMLMRIAAALRSLDVTVTVVAPSRPGALADAAEATGITTIRLTASSRAEWMRALRTWDRRVRLTGRPPAGVLWCNGLVPAVATAGHAARVVHLHQRPVSRAQAALVPIARLGATATVVPSDFMRRAIPGSVVLSNWTGPDLAVQASRDRDPARPVTVGFLGRLSVRKGVVILADAIRTLDLRAPGRYRLLVAGEPRFVAPEDYAPVEAALAALGDRAERPGWMDRDEFLARVDVVAMPSQMHESFGMGAAEAMAARVPVVVSDDGALPEVVGAEGCVVPAGDAAALADAIEALTSPGGVTDAEPRDGLGHTTRVERQFQRWQEHFSPEAGRGNLAALLHEIANTRRR